VDGTIRLAKSHDAVEIAAIYAPYVTNKPTSFELVPPSEHEMLERVESTLTQLPWLVYEENDQVLGYAYSSMHGTREAYRWSVQASVYIRDDSHRRGIGRALYASLFAILRAQGFYSAYAGISLPNPGSVGIHESFGFTSVGVYNKAGYKMGKWHDVGWWQLELQPYPDTPSETIPIGTLAQSEAWDELVNTGIVIQSEAKNLSE
jgi:L-amino acid N-acyltransferase YncA